MSNTRKAAAGVGGVATVLLLLLLWPMFIEGDPLLSGDLRNWVTWIFWILAIVLIVLLFQERNNAGADQVEIEGPAFARFLFGNRQAGLLWLPIRLFLGVSWLEAGWHKFTGEGWIDGGAALKGYWTAAVAIPDQGRPAISFEWYRDFLNFLLSIDASPWFAWIITFGEMAVGLGLIVGLLTGVAAFFGVTMNMSFLLAGSASIEPDHGHARPARHPGLEGRRLLRPRPLGPAHPGYALEAGQGSHAGSSTTDDSLNDGPAVPDDRPTPTRGPGRPPGPRHVRNLQALDRHDVHPSTLVCISGMHSDCKTGSSWRYDRDG